MINKLDDTAQAVREKYRRHVGQERYRNGGGVSRKDWLKLLGTWLVAFFAAWFWHDGLGHPLPSPEVMEFAAATAFGVTGLVTAGVAHARRNRP